MHFLFLGPCLTIIIIITITIISTTLDLIIFWPHTAWRWAPFFHHNLSNVQYLMSVTTTPDTTGSYPRMSFWRDLYEEAMKA